ncbi:MAG: FIST N-terminal domain-containing protein [Polyangiaceae bacterium]
MKLSTFSFEAGHGWSQDAFPPLDSPQTLVLVFAGAGFLDAPGPIDEIVARYPTSVVVGCSSAGEIHGARISDDSISVAVARFERGSLRLATTEVGNGVSSSAAGEALAKQLRAEDLRAMFVLSDGLRVNGTEMLAGIHGVLAPSVAVTGGLAGDGGRFRRTWVLAGGKLRSFVVVAVGLYGDAIGVSHGSRGGWDAFGPERIVTRSEGNVLHTLDDEPALALYKTYLGERAEGLPATALLFPLALRSAGASQTLVRTILSIDEDSQTMTFAGDIPENSIVQLMRTNFERLIDGASQASEAAAGPSAGDSLTVAVSCVGRRIVLGERAEEEVEAAVDGLPAGGQMVGFYSYGEISPFAPGECGVLHNQTMTLTRLWEQ